MDALKTCPCTVSGFKNQSLHFEGLVLESAANKHQC